jgi:hypothetical protein
VVAWVPDLFQNFYFVKKYKNANNSTTAEAQEKSNDTFEIPRILKFFDVCFNKFKNNPILLYKISHQFLVTNKLIIYWVIHLQGAKVCAALVTATSILLMIALSTMHVSLGGVHRRDHVLLNVFFQVAKI